MQETDVEGTGCGPVRGITPISGETDENREKSNNASLLPRFERRTSQTRRGRVSGLCTHILTRVFESVSECGRVRICKSVCESLWACVWVREAVCVTVPVRVNAWVCLRNVCECVRVCETVLYRRCPTVTSTFNRLLLTYLLHGAGSFLRS